VICAHWLTRPFGRYGIYRLTQPPGLPHIMQCKLSATFHQHSIDNIYTSADHPPGHVFETSKLDVTVKDLRPGFAS
jgi:STAM-binding protein